MTHKHRYSPDGYCEEQTDDGICGERLPVPSVIELEEDCGAGAIPALFEAFGRACREGKMGN